MTAIQTHSLTKKYKDVTAVDHVNLSIEQGKLFALLGVNGAGKTTMIKMLSCLIQPTSGDAELLGNSIVKHPILVKEKINISPQETAVAPNLTVFENLSLICGIYGHSKKSANQKATKMIDALGLGEVSGKKAKTLSGGWKRRLSIGMALITDPEILFLDEPTLGLDVLARRELWQMIQALKGKITIILTTHYLEEAEALSDCIGIMSQSKLIKVGTAEELMQETKTQNFEDAFLTLCGKGEMVK